MSAFRGDDRPAAAAHALEVAVWTAMADGRSSDAVQSAQKLSRLWETVDLASGDDDVVYLAETVLTCAERLDWRRITGRSASLALREQARVMRGAVLRRARDLDGPIGAAITVNAEIALADVLVFDRRLVASALARAGRRTMAVDELAALDQVREHARRAGAQGRWIQLTLVRAVVLSEGERRSEALQTLDQLSTELRGQPWSRVAVRLLRRAL